MTGYGFPTPEKYWLVTNFWFSDKILERVVEVQLHKFLNEVDDPFQVVVQK